MFGNRWLEESKEIMGEKQKSEGSNNGKKEIEKKEKRREGESKRKSANEPFLVILTFSFVMMLLVLPIY